MKHFHSRYVSFLFLVFPAIALGYLAKSGYAALTDVLRDCCVQDFESKLVSIAQDVRHSLERIRVRPRTLSVPISAWSVSLGLSS